MSTSDVRSVDLRVPVPSAEGDTQWEVAATVYLPATDKLSERPASLIVMPGGGYSRRYFDLPVPGLSQVRHHARQGTVVVAIDHLGAGDSTIPPAEVSTLSAVAKAGHVAVTEILGQLREGTLAPGVPPLDLAGVVGAGHSIGGQALAFMQANHRTFDGVAMLGSSLVGTSMPTKPGAPKAVVPDAATPEQAATAMAGTDWSWAFHWLDTPVLPELASLIAADIAAGLPTRRAAAQWASLTYPGFIPASVLPGAVADEAARIDVPVLLATGERDVCHPPPEEVAALKAATDISVLVVPRMAHMHNFATTAALLWRRLDEFVTHVTRTKEGPDAGL